MRVLVTSGEGVVARVLRRVRGEWVFGNADLRSAFDTDTMFCSVQPTHVVHFVAPLGDFIDEARAAVNIVDACRRYRVSALVVCHNGADDVTARPLARRLAIETGVRRVDLTLPEVFGPYFCKDSRDLVPTLVRRAVHDTELFCANDAPKTVAYSKDVAEAVATAVGGAAPPVVRTWTLRVRDLARAVASVCGCEFSGPHASDDTDDTPVVPVDLRHALETTVGWYLATCKT